MRVNVPPIKSQGIKTKLVPWVKSIVPEKFSGVWVEPFMGTGVVAFNIAPANALLCDTNPHLVNFYSSIANGEITSGIVRDYLNAEGQLLLEKGEGHYYEIRARFNKHHSPLDFLFLNRAGFNGMIRFNKKGEFNIPFCRKPQRFAQAYVTKIVNQVSCVEKLLRTKNFVFKCQDFSETIKEASSADILYCDPPYIDRHVDYYSGWNESNETGLYDALSNFTGRFILSTWHHNDYRENEYIKTLWSKFDILTREHFYHVGGKEENRNSVMEALVVNFPVKVIEIAERKSEQLMLLAS
ncbi:MAG: Dam family site-specific DNA-(adenine-N6)-methyltransferase [Terracidiphilus sp.]|nr:Dam family site-specific DNA-(adenine-N6)-methyltransferase [Terracidiphilus sp.]MDR3776046.1 Dam family site-specific DNA-(adenine-N6)-methyltransferase [Terracidiphilus sp.]